MFTIPIPEFPQCAEPCGACDSGDDAPMAYVVELRVQSGDTVVVDQIVAVVETDKTTLEIPAPQAGTVVTITAPVGAQLAIGAVLMVMRRG
jgi:pyruvate dehydrogenase E2 component (dihydrolipoamide acetyltransferase)